MKSQGGHADRRTGAIHPSSGHPQYQHPGPPLVHRRSASTLSLAGLRVSSAARFPLIQPHPPLSTPSSTALPRPSLAPWLLPLPPLPSTCYLLPATLYHLLLLLILTGTSSTTSGCLSSSVRGARRSACSKGGSRPCTTSRGPCRTSPCRRLRRRASGTSI